MLSRASKRISSTSSASARAGIRSLVLGADKGEDAVYASKTFEDGEASPSPAGTPIGSRRPSMTAGFAARRDSASAARSSFAMTSISSTPEAPASRTITTTATNAASVLPGISAVPIDASPSAPPPLSIKDVKRKKDGAELSYEHGSYEFSPKELAAVKKRVEEEFLLKSVVSARGAQPKILASKVPFEFSGEEGAEITHPSGFVVPSPYSSHTGPSSSTYLSELRAQNNAKADATAAVRESVARFSGLRDLQDVGMTTRRGKVPQEMLLEDGSSVHGSGFIPPTPQESNMESVKEMYKPAVRAH